MFYEVFIPSANQDGFDVTITVEADNWMMALKSGLTRTGEGEEAIRNVMCDIKEDNSIHVTDATSRRVFVLRQTEEAQAEDTVDREEDLTTLKMQAPDFDALQAQRQDQPAPPTPAQPASPTPAQPAPPTPVQPASPAPAQPPVSVSQSVTAEAPAQSVIVEHGLSEVSNSATSEAVKQDDSWRRIGSSTFEALRRDEEPAKVVREERIPTGQRESVDMSRVDERVSENILEEVFLEINRIHEGDMSMEEVVNFVMDLAMTKVRAEAGSIMFADVNGQELYFATARGPKAHEVMEFRVPMGRGIVGFCAREGVSLAISDAENDPRFYRAISDALGYETKSLCCAPVQYEGRVYGAVELLNKDSQHFSATEMNVLNYIGRQLARYVHDLIMAREKLE